MTPPEFASKTNEYLTSYIFFADTKGGAILTFTSIVGAAVGFVSPVLLAAARTAGPLPYVLGWLAASGVALGVTLTLWYCLDAVTPRTPKTSAEVAKSAPAIAKSLHSFPDIAGMLVSDFTTGVAKLQPADTATELSLHNFTLAKIVSQKYASLRVATFWLRVALLSTVADAVLFAVASVVGGSK